jgi:hypothetical protein
MAAASFARRHLSQRTPDRSSCRQSGYPKSSTSSWLAVVGCRRGARNRRRRHRRRRRRRRRRRLIRPLIVSVVAVVVGVVIVIFDVGVGVVAVVVVVVVVMVVGVVAVVVGAVVVLFGVAVSLVHFFVVFFIVVVGPAADASPSSVSSWPMYTKWRGCGRGDQTFTPKPRAEGAGLRDIRLEP